MLFPDPGGPVMITFGALSVSLPRPMRPRVGQDRDSSSDKGLSLTSLMVGSVSSAAAAVVVHALWEPGTIIGAAATPVLMALFAEALRRPAERITLRTGAGDAQPATIEVHRPAWRWRKAVVTGLAAFALGAAGLTLSEAVLDRAIADRDAGTTLFDGATRSAPSPDPAASPTPEPSPTDGRSADEPQDRARRSRGSERSGPTPTPTSTTTAQPTPSVTPPAAAPTPTPR